MYHLVPTILFLFYVESFCGSEKNRCLKHIKKNGTVLDVVDRMSQSI